MLWSDSRKERDDWLKYLEIASGNKKFKEFFSIGEKIGQGKFSDVYICTEHVSYKKWAVKVINKSKLSALEKELLSSEIKILKIVSHPNIVKIKEIFDSKKHILIVMELIEGGELFELIQKRKVFSEYATSKIIKQLLDAVIYLHELGILHRDIKPENILLADNSDIPNIKLADFGLSKLAGPNEVQLLACGTLGYVAPEVLSQGGYSFKADLWSVGIITYLLLRGRLPFDHKDKKVLIDLTLKACLNFDEPYWKAFTPFALSFLNQAIHKRPEERLGPLAALEHSWIKNSEILIPRAIDKKKMEEMFIEKGVSSTNFGKVQYREIALDVNANPAVTFEVRSMPDLYEEAPADGAGETIMVNSIID
jgi:serine/threonine protein kinase